MYLLNKPPLPKAFCSTICPTRHLARSSFFVRDSSSPETCLGLGLAVRDKLLKSHEWNDVTLHSIECHAPQASQIVNSAPDATPQASNAPKRPPCRVVRLLTLERALNRCLITIMKSCSCNGFCLLSRQK